MISIELLSIINTLYIGDDLQDDVFAAQAVGMQSIWLNREGVPNPQIPVSAIETLYDLVAPS